MPDEPTQPHREAARPSSAHDERVYGYGPPPADDEIGLFDLWDALVRRRWLIVGVAVAVVLAALAYALTRPDVYRYQISVDIGHVGGDGGSQKQPIASVEMVMAELRSSIIPNTLRDVLGFNQADGTTGGAPPSVNVESPDGAGIVKLSIEGPETKGERYREILRRTAGRVVRDHAGVLEIEQSRLSRRLAQLQRERKRIAGELDTIEARIQRLNGSDAAAQGGAALRLDALHQRAGALEMQLLKIEAERDRLSDALEVLRDRATVFGKALEPDVVARQRQASQAIASLEMGVRPTRVLAAPDRSLRQVGTSGTLILALGIILGGMLGVFAAFFAEFLAAARRRHEGQSGTR